MATLKDFYNDDALREEWTAFVLDAMNKEALERVYKKKGDKNTDGFADARDILERAFAELNKQFAITEKRKQRSAV